MYLRMEGERGEQGVSNQKGVSIVFVTSLFCSNAYKGRGGQTFGLFKCRYFMDGSLTSERRIYAFFRIILVSYIFWPLF